MAQSNEIVSGEKYESETVKNFITQLKTGQSILQKPSKEPFYSTNALTGKFVTGFNQLVISQALKDKENRLYITGAQLNFKKGLRPEFQVEKGKSSICTVFLRDDNAYYKKDDEEVKNGKAKAGDHKLDENGKMVKDQIPSFIYAADDIRKSKAVVQNDANGNPLKYEKDVYAKDKDGNTLTYKEDYTFTKDGKEITEKAGNPVIEHYAGSKVVKYQPSEEKLVVNNEQHSPKLTDSNDLAPLYKRRNDSGKEILLEGMTKAFRGMMNGDYEGWNPNMKEIQAIESEYISHPRAFVGVCDTAYKRATGTKAEVAKIDENVSKKEKKQSEEKVNTNTNTKKHSR